MGRRTATTSNGSKSFDPKTSSTRGAAVPQFMTNPHHTQKIDSEPPEKQVVMQKSYSPDVTFMMSDEQHTYEDLREKIPLLVP